VHFRVEGKGGKMRFIPVHPHTIQRVREYLALVARGRNSRAALFWPVMKPSSGVLEKPHTGHAIYKNAVQKYARELGIEATAICVNGLRTTAATNALDHSADIAKVQEWLGHLNISTTWLYDRRKTKAEDSPTFRVTS
jgi:integrase/recombinase XerD